MSDSNPEAEKISFVKTESKIKIETPKEFGNSIFSEVYNSAKQNVLKIISYHENENENDYPSNNIIAFTGERGKGKSSTMISFLLGLKSIQNGNREDSFFYEFYKNSAYNPKYHFITLNVIDPSLFRGKESLFEIILAKMFSLFKQSLENNHISHHSPAILNEEGRRELVKHFQTVFGNLKYTNGNLKDELYQQDALDALIKLSTSSNLRESFQKLIKCYLNVLGKQDGDCKNFLVIAIDDFDLKIEGIYDMLEDIRQFLISQRVIILIACKMEQIREAVQTSIYSAFLTKLGEDKSILESITNESELIGKAEKYVSKLIPLSRRIVLPNIEIIKDSDKENLLDKIPKQVFEKIGIYVNPDLFNAFYPETLREYHSLEKIAGEDLRTEKQRVEYFKNYLIEKISNIKTHRNLTELIMSSTAKNYVINFKQILQKIQSDLTTKNNNGVIKIDHSNSYPDIIGLYQQLLIEIPKYENNLQKLVSLYRTYFNIQHYEYSQKDNSQYLKIYDGRTRLLPGFNNMNNRRDFFPISFPKDSDKTNLMRYLKPLIYSFGESKIDYSLQDIPQAIKHFDLSPINGILYDNPDLAKYFNIDMVLKYFECFEKPDPIKQKISEYPLLYQIFYFTKIAIDYLPDLLFNEEKESEMIKDLNEKKKGSEMIKDLIEASKFYQLLSDTDNFIHSEIKEEINLLKEIDLLLNPSKEKTPLLKALEISLSKLSKLNIEVLEHDDNTDFLGEVDLKERDSLKNKIYTALKPIKESDDHLYRELLSIRNRKEKSYTQVLEFIQKQIIDQINILNG